LDELRIDLPCVDDYLYEIFSHAEGLELVPPGASLAMKPASLSTKGTVYLPMSMHDLKVLVYKGDSSWLVEMPDQAKGTPGLAFRGSKRLDDRIGSFAPWGSLLKGLDTDDGWLETQLQAQEIVRQAAKKIISLLDCTRLDVCVPFFNAPDRQQFSIFHSIPQVDRDLFISMALADAIVDRAVGAMVGMAVADALGAPLEFVPVCQDGHSFDPVTLQYSGIHNSHNLKPGQWTDDTSMGLCIADSLLTNSGYDGSDIRVRFWNWWYRRYNNAFRKEIGGSDSIGLGGNTANSLKSMSDNSPPPRYEADSDDSGNGSLMRLAPVAIFFHNSLDTVIQRCRESSYTTHPGKTAADLCGFLGYLIASAMQRGCEKEDEEHVRGPYLQKGEKVDSTCMTPGCKTPSWNRTPGGYCSRQCRDNRAQVSTAAEFLDTCVQRFLAHSDSQNCSDALVRLLHASEADGSTERCWNWRDPNGPFIKETVLARGGSYNGYAFSAGYFGSYSVDALAIALHCVYHTASFTDAVARCVNFLGDADSTGSITGQIAGAFYGYSQIDRRCVSNLERWDDREVALRGALLCVLGSQHSA